MFCFYHNYVHSYSSYLLAYYTTYMIVIMYVYTLNHLIIVATYISKTTCIQLPQECAHVYCHVYRLVTAWYVYHTLYHSHYII